MMSDIPVVLAYLEGLFRAAFRLSKFEILKEVWTLFQIPELSFPSNFNLIEFATCPHDRWTAIA
jgi:hypothetical protein